MMLYRSVVVCIAYFCALVCARTEPRIGATPASCAYSLHVLVRLPMPSYHITAIRRVQTTIPCPST